MSGWWFAASASSATRLTNAIAAAKSANVSSRTIVALGALCQSGAALRRCSISASLSSAMLSAGYSQMVRIVSLVPHATELLFALGLSDQVVAVTHECDHPPAAVERPRVTRDALPADLSAAQIDAAVRERTLAARPSTSSTARRSRRSSPT